VEWFAHGRIVSSSDESAPVLLLGSDSYGRDVFSRLVYGARLSLLVAVASAIGALLLGALVGGISGYAGGILDDLLMRGSDFVIVLPAMYIALALRSAMKLVLPPVQVFALLTGIFAVSARRSCAGHPARSCDRKSGSTTRRPRHHWAPVRVCCWAAGGGVFIGVEITLLIGVHRRRSTLHHRPGFPIRWRAGDVCRTRGRSRVHRFSVAA
jgi:ABC-type dipeptide/oligopeptide/nickel transport system permease component